MSTAIVTAATAFHLCLGFAVFFGLLGIVLSARRRYRSICKAEALRIGRREARRRSSDPWSFPPKDLPVAETHLGKQRVGERRAA